MIRNYLLTNNVKFGNKKYALKKRAEIFSTRLNVKRVVVLLVLAVVRQTSQALVLRQTY